MSGPKYIRFVELPTGPGRKTLVWGVFEKIGPAYLGRVSWFGRWRCYGFFPDPGTVYEHQCLRDIADFCEAKTKEHREALAAAK